MKINCIIDDVNISTDVYTHMPLNDFILQMKICSSGIFPKCKNNNCLNCLCFIEDSMNLSENREIFPSCLVPLFKANGKKITTCDYYVNSEEARDLFDAYELLQIKPCNNCFSAKTMLLSFIINEYLNFESRTVDFMLNSAEYKKYLISSNMQLSSCSCLSDKNIELIVDTGIKIRRNRIV